MLVSALGNAYMYLLSVLTVVIRQYNYFGIGRNCHPKIENCRKEFSKLS